MSISKKLKDFLDAHGIKYTIITHPTAYTAQEIAAAMHVHGKELAKSVILKADGKFIMAVLPATQQIAFNLLREALGAKEVELATETEFQDLFPDCEIGAMPPFGNLYNVPVYVASLLTQDEEIIFNAGSHTEAIKMSYKDFERLVKPTVAKF